MEYLIKPNGDGIFVEKESGKAMIDSRTVADVFEKSHPEVLESIDSLIEAAYNLDDSGDFAESNFQRSTYKSITGEIKPCYNMTHDGFCLFIVENPVAAAMVEKYLTAFSEMESHVSQFYDYYEEFPEYAEAIKEHFEREGKISEFVYRNESDMINKIVLGMTAEKFKEANEIDEYTMHILPYLEKKQLHMVKLLRAMDIAYLEMDLPYKERKKNLERYVTRRGWNVAAKMILKGDA